MLGGRFTDSLTHTFSPFLSLSLRVDADGEEFPWHEPTLTTLMGTERIPKRDGTGVTMEDLMRRKDGWALLFTASWSPTCPSFFSLLSRVDEEMRKMGKDFEIVWVNVDQDEGEYEKERRERESGGEGGGWGRMAFADRRRVKLDFYFANEEFPSLLTFVGDQLINRKAHRAVTLDPTGTSFPWPPPPQPPHVYLDPQSDDLVEEMHDRECVLLNVFGCSHSEEGVRFTEHFKETAELFSKSVTSSSPLFVIVSGEPSPPLSERRVRVCDSGHSLTLQVKDESWRCDRCALGTGEESWCCDECDYDVCVPCFAASLAPAGKKEVLLR